MLAYDGKVASSIPSGPTFGWTISEKSEVVCPFQIMASSGDMPVVSNEIGEFTKMG